LKAANTVLERATQVANGLTTEPAYDLILMDVQMPVMDGMTASKRIRDTVAAAFQPYIVALTAQAMQGDRYLTLPDPHALIEDDRALVLSC
jgi:CheY-like chemotaxis protein